MAPVKEKHPAPNDKAKAVVKPEEHSALPPGFTEGTVETQESVLVEKPMPKQPMNPNSPLTKAFSKNMQGVYGTKMGDMSKEKQSYGYMLE